MKTLPPCDHDECPPTQCARTESAQADSVRRVVSGTWTVYIENPKEQTWVGWATGFGSYFDAEEWRKKQTNKDALRVGRKVIELCAANDEFRRTDPPLKP